MKLGHENNNYRVDVFFRGEHYKNFFSEYWLAKVFAEAIIEEKEVESVYFLERFSGNEYYDVAKCLKINGVKCA